MDEIYTVKEASEYLKKTTDTISKWCRNGNLKAKQLPDKSWAISSLEFFGDDKGESQDDKTDNNEQNEKILEAKQKIEIMTLEKEQAQLKQETLMFNNNCDSAEELISNLEEKNKILDETLTKMREQIEKDTISVKENMETANKRLKELNEKQQEISQLEITVKSKNDKLIEKEHELQSRENSIAKKESKVSDKEREIEKIIRERIRASNEKVEKMCDSCKHNPDNKSKKIKRDWTGAIIKEYE